MAVLLYGSPCFIPLKAEHPCGGTSFDTHPPCGRIEAES